MSSSVEIVAKNLIEGLQDLELQDQNKMKGNCTAVVEENDRVGRDTSNATNANNHHGICAICLNMIVLEDTALVKGCEHAYCVNCILKWASYKKETTCPQCKNPFEFLNVHRALDGIIHDYMFEESVCLLLRATWFTPLVIVEREEMDEETEDYFYEDNGEEDLDEVYFGSTSALRLGNRRWGGNGYVRGGRQEARPVHRPNPQDLGAGPSRQARKKEGETVNEAIVGRRAKRALKREAADKAAAEKHEKRLARLGRS